MPLHIVPDYIVYDELKKERARRIQDEQRPQLEVPRYSPYWPELTHENSDANPHDEESERREDQERGETIISMW